MYLLDGILNTVTHVYFTQDTLIKHSGQSGNGQVSCAYIILMTGIDLQTCHSSILQTC